MKRAAFLRAVAHVWAASGSASTKQEIVNRVTVLIGAEEPVSVVPWLLSAAIALDDAEVVAAELVKTVAVAAEKYGPRFLEFQGHRFPLRGDQTEPAEAAHCLYCGWSYAGIPVGWTCARVRAEDEKRAMAQKSGSGLCQAGSYVRVTVEEVEAAGVDQAAGEAVAAVGNGVAATGRGGELLAWLRGSTRISQGDGSTLCLTAPSWVVQHAEVVVAENVKMRALLELASVLLCDLLLLRDLPALTKQIEEVLEATRRPSGK